ncbi:thioredoxin domain-containing protein [Acetobacterium woodii]|uniref:Thymidylate kinase YyaL n=1 Tax=Acetobacterium woodii (strain ATCC 29683 / DSM 1030 / JCM 2381 / KCTC 1655 / WB1) TaxID=931626 RepID=H6LCM4_ACEWD|nr:thioredoxin domain-containing protein [Acetobacterium woodii]AFA47806.1 thymidylate kinase YyaL [Acetobacterium woodii DSM 1030]
MALDNKQKKSNRLVHEMSPYLLQHAYNPVNWYPWSDEAFNLAKRQDKPIFLSIGYSTCHWCHVMEKESFEDAEVAEYLNKYFISIKVDREERPDIDQIYMTFSQVSTGQGGWPLNVFLTAERKPFYVTTYLPKRSRYGHPGLMDVLVGIEGQWRQNNEEIIYSADKMTSLLNDLEIRKDENKLKRTIFFDAYDFFDESFDDRYGGFGKAPKFPTPHHLFYLLRCYQAFNQPDALVMVEKTLKQMYQGGLFDHIGFGFSRYSTDEQWLVPHFEKMLYDNALLVMIYAETYQVTGNPLYKKIAQKTITYVNRDLRSEEGGFFCAEDADSEGEEGRFYVWSMEKVEKILGKKRAAVFFKFYPMTAKGNFDGKNIPNMIPVDLDLIEANPELEKVLDEMKADLFNQREKRIHPHKDDKILTAWNGLMITALAMAGRIFDQPEYLIQAEETMAFIENKMTRRNGRLYARYRLGEAKILAYLDDYASVIWGYLELYQATFKTEYLEKAILRAVDMINIFGDDFGMSGFFQYGNDAEKLIARPKEIYDNAQPSGNALAACCLLKLGKITGEQKYIDIVNGMFAYFAGNLNQAPMASTMMLCAKLFHEQPTTEVVFAGYEKDPTIRAMNQRLNKLFLPFSVVLFNKSEKDLKTINAFAVNQQMIHGQPTAYVCKNYRCEEPVNDLESFLKIIEE